jgi:hypothetical protein
MGIPWGAPIISLGIGEFGGDSVGSAHDFSGDWGSRGKRILVDTLTTRRIDIVFVIDSHYPTRRRCRPIHPLRSLSPSPRCGWRRSSATFAPRPARWSTAWSAQPSAGSAPPAEKNARSGRCTILTQGFPVIGKGWESRGNYRGNQWDFAGILHFQDGARFPATMLDTRKRAGVRAENSGQSGRFAFDAYLVCFILQNSSLPQSSK